MRNCLPIALALVALALVALAGGRNWIGPGAIWSGLRDPDDFVIRTLRLPRVLIAVGVGAALGLAGALMQGLTRNPLATPDVIGLVQGAGLGYALALATGAALLPGAAGGAAAAMLAVALLSRGQGALAVVLYGIGVGATAMAATTVLLVRAPDAAAAQAMIWLSGSLARADLATATALWSVLGAALAAVALAAHRLSTLWLGDEVMAALGIDPRRMRWLVLALVTALTAAGTLAAGPIGFLAFTAAPLARAVTGAEPPSLLPAALMGACLLTAADLAARLIAPVAVFPTGLVVSLIGAPYLVFFLWRDRRAVSP